ncbi:expressed unknown protein [Seminavis robusta]|uniref:C6H2-type domain-containing protein n=1 Tax=Seminavis robusta TaxID=568900 RepID=A0A9N8H2N8_9STRA|nr:expressed unknown protein [Seminavis robusta]|eukprot:Sro40_g024800.1 n/a (433) ;mRNA; f:102358-103656
MGKGKKQSMKTGKTQRFCAGCQKAEPMGERFKQCPRCTEEGFVPAVFCSDSCFKAAWPEHKEWHSKAGQESKGTLERIFQVVAKPWAADSDSSYLDLLEQSTRLLANGDINGAKKILQKAQNLSPKDPAAFLMLCIVYHTCNQKGEAATCANEACKRLALTTVTGFIGDKQIPNHDKDPMFAYWALFVSDVFEWCGETMDNILVPKPNWWHQDGMRKRITKVALSGLKGSSLDVILAWQDPKLLAGVSPGNIIARLRRQRLLSLSQCLARDDVLLPLNRTSEELEEGAALLKSIQERDKELGNTFPHLLGKITYDIMTADPINGSPLEIGEAGLWVLIHGLESKAGKALNGKVGLIFKDGVESDRVAVEVDGFDGEKRIRPKNLWELPFSEKQVALISTMDKDDQWTHVKGSGQLSLAHRCLAGRSVQSTWA